MLITPTHRTVNHIVFSFEPKSTGNTHTHAHAQTRPRTLTHHARALVSVRMYMHTSVYVGTHQSDVAGVVVHRSRGGLVQLHRRQVERVGAGVGDEDVGRPVLERLKQVADAPPGDLPPRPLPLRSGTPSPASGKEAAHRTEQSTEPWMDLLIPQLSRERENRKQI